MRVELSCLELLKISERQAFGFHLGFKAAALECVRLSDVETDWGVNLKCDQSLDATA